MSISHLLRYSLTVQNIYVLCNLEQPPIACTVLVLKYCPQPSFLSITKYSQCDLGHSRNRHPRSPPAPPLWLDPPSARVSSLAVGFKFRCTGFGFGCTGLTCASRRRERVVRTEACSEFLFHFRPFSNLDLFFRQNLKLIVDFDPAVGY